MTRYFFDINDNGKVYPDEEGLELVDLPQAKAEAVATLSGLLKDAGRTDGDHEVAVGVRANKTLLYHAAFVLHGPKH